MELTNKKVTEIKKLIEFFGITKTDDDQIGAILDKILSHRNTEEEYAELKKQISSIVDENRVSGRDRGARNSD